jgi:RimJ/RimL family protein N-acetyltransferase
MFKKTMRILLLFSLLTTALYQPIKADFSFSKALWVGLGCAAAAIAVGAHQWQKSETQQVKNEGTIENFNKERDLQKVAALISASSVQMYGSKRTVEQASDLICQFLKDSYSIKVLYEKKELVAFITYHPRITKSVGRIGALCADERYRKKGYGTQLFNAVRDELWNAGVDLIQWGAHKNNVGAQKFYERLGAVVLKVDPQDSVYSYFYFKSALAKAHHSFYCTIFNMGADLS